MFDMVWWSSQCRIRWLTTRQMSRHVPLRIRCYSLRTCPLWSNQEKHEMMTLCSDVSGNHRTPLGPDISLVPQFFYPVVSNVLFALWSSNINNLVTAIVTRHFTRTNSPRCVSCTWSCSKHHSPHEDLQPCCTFLTSQPVHSRGDKPCVLKRNFHISGNRSPYYWSVPNFADYAMNLFHRLRWLSRMERECHDHPCSPCLDRYHRMSLRHRSSIWCLGVH